jgi:hypothetical protein
MATTYQARNDASRSTQTTASPGTTRQSPPVTTTERCCRCGCPPPTCTCCELICFERPVYHCGHLLTDADLSLQMRYVVEKNKLRNRALHGYGVVCGLRLTCDPDCEGHILVHEGYAIDDCGNDIVVCETRRFDVIAALSACGLLVKPPEREPCAPCPDERGCHIEQCFYVTICYEEEDADYTTPFQVDCAAGPQDCVPTRVKERYRLEITDRLPPHHSWLEQFEKRLHHCFRVFADSPVGRLIRHENKLLQEMARCDVEREYDRERRHCECELFCQLKAHFQHQLRMRPDELECVLAHEVACLCCPDDCHEDYPRRMAEVVCRLLELMHRYQYDCVLADLAFSCSEPAEACCVVLGCVEVRDGCLVRVCSTPRRYVWSFANFWPVAINTLLSGGLLRRSIPQDEKGGNEHRGHHCCPDYDRFDCCAFLAEFAVSEYARMEAAMAPLHAVRAVHDSLSQAFAFTDSAAYAPSLFTRLDTGAARAAAERLGIRLEMPADPAPPAAADPVQALLGAMLLRRDDRVLAYPDADGILRALRRDDTLQAAPAAEPPERRAELQAAHRRIDELAGELTRRDQSIEQLRGVVEALTHRIEQLEPPPDDGTPTRRGRRTR